MSEPSMEEVIIHNPSVSDLVKELSKLPQDMKIIISDADTGWTIDIIHINEYGGKIEMSGDYSEMGTYEVKE